jgi:hypothetical protein
MMLFGLMLVSFLCVIEIKKTCVCCLGKERNCEESMLSAFTDNLNKLEYIFWL